MTRVWKPSAMRIPTTIVESWTFTRSPIIRPRRPALPRWIRPSRNAVSASSCTRSKQNRNVTPKRRTIPNINCGSNRRNSIRTWTLHGCDSVRRSSTKAISWELSVPSITSSTTTRTIPTWSRNVSYGPRGPMPRWAGSTKPKICCSACRSMRWAVSTPNSIRPLRRMCCCMASITTMPCRSLRLPCRTRNARYTVRGLRMCSVSSTSGKTKPTRRYRLIRVSCGWLRPMRWISMPVSVWRSWAARTVCVSYAQWPNSPNTKTGWIRSTVRWEISTGQRMIPPKLWRCTKRR